jgi:hypothetical protein
MTDTKAGRLNALAHDEKVTPVAVYTLTGMAVGKLITKEQVRVSTWLRTDMAPVYLSLHEARFLSLAGSERGQSLAFPELNLPTAQTLAFHLLPPASDPLDYDPNEPHRKMEPVSAILGFFRFDGLMRMSTHSTLGQYLEVTKETFTPFYEVKIANMAIPSLKAVRASYALVRQDASLFATRTESELTQSSSRQMGLKRLSSDS